MSLVYTDITLKNATDVANAASGIVDAHKIRQTTVRALADTGAWTLVISEAVRAKLGLRIMKSARGTLADGSKSDYNLAGPVEVIWRDRSTNCDAIVLPQTDETLLGAIPLEGMDLMIHPRTEEVVGVHGDEIVYSLR
ncbi:MAG: retroviral-like aspartic protease family protein [Spirochaetes bacterium]|nr:retroviral-like aspartic protease family protein [Spirochaetota bacterium]